MIEIHATGGMTTVQDTGRFGLRRLGVGVSGPLDAVAAALGNSMVGNTPDCAFLEIVLFPFRVTFRSDARIAVTGADVGARLDGVATPPWWSAPVRAGQVLDLPAPAEGGVAYLCVAGGIDVPAVLGSRSTDLKAAFGGFQGRPLRKGDVLPIGIGPMAGGPRQRRCGIVPPRVALAQPGAHADAPGTTTVRVLPAAQWDSFPPAAQRLFAATPWRISPASNRIGLRLEGPALQPRRRTELLSHGIVPGVVQVPPGGQPIVMQCDAQTAGGYPKMATVIEADQWRLAQARLGSHVRFQPVDLDAALAASTELQAYLDRTQRAIEVTN